MKIKIGNTYQFISCGITTKVKVSSFDKTTCEIEFMEIIDSSNCRSGELLLEVQKMVSEKFKTETLIMNLKD